MRYLKWIIPSVVLAFGAVATCTPVQEAQAADRYEETVSLSSAAAVTGTVQYAGQVSIQCDGEVRYRTCPKSSGCTAVATDARVTNFDLPFDVCTLPSGEYVSLIRTGSSTVTCYLYNVTPPRMPCAK